MRVSPLPTILQWGQLRRWVAFFPVLAALMIGVATYLVGKVRSPMTTMVGRYLIAPSPSCGLVLQGPHATHTHDQDH